MAKKAETKDANGQLRKVAEDLYAEELEALGRATTGRGRPTGGSRRGPSSPICWAGTTKRRRDHAQVHRQPPADRDRRRHAGHRPRAAAARRAGHGQDVGLRAPGRGDQRRLDAARAGHGRHRRGSRSATAGTTPGCWPKGPSRDALVPSPVMRAMEEGKHRPRRGADPHPGRRAGRADHHPVGEDAADPRARRRGAGRSRASTSSPPPTTATGASTSCPRALKRRFNTVVLPLPRDARGGGRDRRKRVAELGRALELPAEPPASRRSAASSPSSASCAAA